MTPEDLKRLQKLYKNQAKPDNQFQETQLDDAEKDSEVSVIESVFAGIGSGLIEIPKGLFSLGAAIYDLTNDTNKAAEVEKWFDDLTTLDEKAEATAAGKITQTLINIGVPGGIAFTKGASLASKALRSKKLGQYFTVNNPNLIKGAKKAAELNAKGKTARFVAGATAGGLAEGVFVGDVEEAGTFGDLLGGPTELKRDEEYDPERELINRIKFGTEGALFTGVLGGVGQTLKKLAQRGKELRYSNSAIDRTLDKFASGFRSRGKKTAEFFQLEREQVGLRSADVNLAQQVARDLDKNIDAIFPPAKTVFNKQTAKQRTETLGKMNDLLLSGKPVVNNAGDVKFGKLDPKLKEAMTGSLKKFGAKDENIEAIYANMNAIREGWGQMFSSLGGKLEDKQLKEFKDLFGKKFQSYLGSTYDIFQNKSLLPFLNFKPAEELVDKTAKMFKQTALQNGQKITDEQAKYYVERLVKTARLPKGFRMDKPSDPVFQIPDFFVGKTVLDDAVTDKGFTSLSALPKEQQKIIKELLGETKNPMQTILGGTGRLSMVARRNEFFQNLANESDKLKDAGQRGMFYETESEALKALGPDVKKINIDPNKTLEAGIVNPLNGKYAINEIADALEETAAMTRSNSMVGKLYENLVLYPKATSQIAKTILSPVTHVRNFVSAGAFATANGAIPNPEAIKTAYQALQTPLKGTRQQSELYRKLLKLGVVNSNVRLGDLQNLLKDVGFGETMTSDKGLRALLKPLSKAKQVAQDFYTAEDDFWKIATWATEKSRLEKAYAKYGIKRTAAQLEEEAANIVRNNLPNYDYVSDFVKSLRRLPVGNFVSFPAEILRTSTNIVKRGLDEISYKVTLADGRVVRPLAKIGYQRLVGMGVTTAALPVATVEAAKMIYDVTEDEMEAIRRYVADWSKNSTIIPIKDKKTGELKYIDFSHANAYDTIVRPIQTITNEVAAGRDDKDGMMDDFLRGALISMRELGQPFISESIWTEAVTDIIVRGGRTREGSEVYNPEDTPGDKATKIMKHLVEAQAPFSWKQLQRLDLAIKPVDVIQKGKFDKYGQTYELGDELAGFVGARPVKLNPARALDFKIAEFQKGVRDSRRLFTRETLRGGPITPKEIVDSYINANRALFQVKKNLMKDYEAAKILKVSENDLDTAFERVSKKEYFAIQDGEFRPLNISKDVQEVFEENAIKLDLNNPYPIAEPVLDKIKDILEQTPLSLDQFPEFVNPFDNLPEPQLQTPGQLPPLPQPQVLPQFGQLPTQPGGLTYQQEYAGLFPYDTLGQTIAQRKR